MAEKETKCRGCGSSLEIYEIDERRGTKIARCTRCGMLHMYKKDVVGRWRMFKAQKAEIPPLLISGVERLTEEASFLMLDANWSDSTIALQMQEVAVVLVAGKIGISLDKADVERILRRKIQDFSFSDRYEAFSIQVKDLFNTEMPILTGHLRKMRAKVLHEGYNPQPEETESLVSFTIGLLQRLKRIVPKTRKRK